MPLALSDQDLAELQQIVDNEFRGKEAVRITAFFQAKASLQQAAAKTTNGTTGATPELPMLAEHLPRD